MRTFKARLCTIAASVIVMAGSGFAQSPSPAPSETTPQATPTAPAQNLSDKLNQSHGVIHPKEVDPAIEKPAPKAGDPNVVPPPGTSGGAAVPQPK
jgi:hypothetical protein